MTFSKSHGFILSCFFFLLACSEYTNAQNSKCRAWKELSCPEKKWVFFHPFIAGKAFSCTVQARQETDALRNDTTLDGDADGGQLDAFRHTYWMALLSQQMKPKKALNLGKAHEKGNYKDFLKGKLEDNFVADSVASAMDLLNNQTGTEIGLQYLNLSADELKLKIIEAVKSGQMKIVYKNKQGNPLTCAGDTIDLKAYHQNWNAPKCLVPSDTLFK